MSEAQRLHAGRVQRMQVPWRRDARCLLICCHSNDLKTTPISYTHNIFSSFAYGISKGPFPFTISIRHEDDAFIVFDDLLSLTR